MKAPNQNVFKYSAVALAVAASGTSISRSMAQEVENQIEKIEITATRRTGTVQEVPLNITALTSDVLAEQNIGDLDDVARWVPGLTVTDQGGRQDSPIIVRGLNTNSSDPSSDGGTVATYMGEIPLFINMRLSDVDRVEVLIGPQGTLYGAGTLGGAIRYIPKAVELDITSGQVYADAFSIEESGSFGGEAGFVFNTPIIEDTLGFRLSLNHFDNPGFIDYNYLVREGGVSLPDPDWSDPDDVAANITQAEDKNGEETTTARAALRWMPNDWFDATLTYFYQKQDVEGRSISHYQSLASVNPLSELVGKYESAYRYEEPREKEDTLLSLEIKADLGFAELVSATGQSSFEAEGQRDQTDLLIRLAYSYEEFPAFSSFTREIDDTDVFTQEVRLVSTDDGPLSWIVGGFYNKLEEQGESREFTPGFDEYVLDVWQTGGNLRPDSLEYISVDDNETVEKAIFGEITYAVTGKLDVTLGARFYEYEVTARSDVDFPLLFTSITVESGAADFRSGDEIILNLIEAKNDDSGNLFKVNASYQATDDVLIYATISEGFRLGGANPVGACDPSAPDDEQQVCALPQERIYQDDTTTNYELGFKSTWFKNKFHFNAALFHVDWEDAQVDGATVNGQQPITRNAGSAESQGVEISSRAMLSDSFTAYAAYSYTRAELTEGVPELFFGNTIAAEAGDRLPGSPEHQFSMGLKYQQEVFGDKLLDVTYGLTSQSDMFTKIGNRESGEEIPGYSLSNLSVSVSDENWAVSLYVDNVFDKYAFTSIRRDKADIGLAEVGPDPDNPIDANTNRFDIQRNYGGYVLTPRTIGLKFTYDFEL